MDRGARQRAIDDGARRARTSAGESSTRRGARHLARRASGLLTGLRRLGLGRLLRRAAGPAAAGAMALVVVLSGLLVPADTTRAQSAPTSTATDTATATATNTSTPTPSNTPTHTATASPTQTNTPSPSPTSTHTATPTRTSSPTASATAAASATVAATATSTGGSSGACGRVTGSPETRWKNAFDCMVTVETAKVTSSQKVTAGSQVTERASTASLARGNADVTEVRSAATAVPTSTPTSSRRPSRGGRTLPSAPSSNATSTRKRVDVGSARYDKHEPATSVRGQTPSWERKSRSAPSQSNAFGALTLADGTSLGTSGLYTRIRELGVTQLNGMHVHELQGEMDMAALARAGRLSGSEASRVQRGSATLTVWVGQTDGLIYKTQLRMVVPSATGGSDTVTESTVSVSDHNATLSVVAPR